MVGARPLWYYSLHFSVCLQYFKIGKRKEISRGILHTFTWTVMDTVLWFSIFSVRISLLCSSSRLLVNVFLLVAEISWGGEVFQPIIPCPPHLVTQSNRLVCLPPPEFWKNQSIQSRVPTNLPGTSSQHGGWRAHLCPGQPPAKCPAALLPGGKAQCLVYFLLCLPSPSFPCKTVLLGYSNISNLFYPQPLDSSNVSHELTSANQRSNGSQVCASEWPEKLIKIQISGPRLQGFWFSSSGWGPVVCWKLFPGSNISADL